eukprot:gene9332-1419_t
MVSEKEIDTTVLKFVDNVRRKRHEYVGRFSIAKKTAELLRIFVSKMKKDNKTSDVIRLIRRVGSLSKDELPSELVIGNIVRRVLFVIRDEYARIAKKKALNLSSDAIDEMEVQHQRNLVSLLDDEREENFSNTFGKIKPIVMDAINDLIDELEDVYERLTDNVTDLVQDNEIILTYGHSKSVESFIIGASKERKIQVIITENPPSFNGHSMAKILSSKGINCSIISDSAVFSIMPRVHKVIVGACAVVANGGLITQCGVNAVALAANYFNVPFVVTVGLYKLTPHYSIDQDSLNNFLNPNEVLPFEYSSKLKNVQVIQPEYDYVPPSFVSLFVLNDKYGTRDTSYIYRLLTDYYHPLDYNLKDEDKTIEETIEESDDFDTDEDIDEDDVVLIE